MAQRIAEFPPGPEQDETILDYARKLAGITQEELKTRFVQEGGEASLGTVMAWLRHGDERQPRWEDIVILNRIINEELSKKKIAFRLPELPPFKLTGRWVANPVESAAPGSDKGRWLHSVPAISA